MGQMKRAWLLQSELQREADAKRKPLDLIVRQELNRLHAKMNNRENTPEDTTLFLQLVLIKQQGRTTYAPR
jgi:hypothetical protein